MKKKKRPSRVLFTLLFVLAVFVVLVITMFIVGVMIFWLVSAGVLPTDSPESALPNILILIFVIASIVVGTFVSFLISRISLRPLNRLIDGMNQLASGNYTTRLYFGESRTGKDLAESFNTLAVELQNTELLRSDFVNSFSHEFKTPIVSILGFARLLNHKAISGEQAKEYLAIIEEEARRLSIMATNVMDMTKIENQNILTDVTKFNLSEQLRTCVLLLEKKWSKRELCLNLDFDEFTISANEEMLKSVWINLLDNAIKFTPQGGNISIIIDSSLADLITVTIQNTGPGIPEADKKRIFTKFYQGDTSRSGDGIGVGLAIAKKVIDLHHGTISVECADGLTSFAVTLLKHIKLEN